MCGALDKKDLVVDCVEPPRWGERVLFRLTLNKKQQRQKHKNARTRVGFLRLRMLRIFYCLLFLVFFLFFLVCVVLAGINSISDSNQYNYYIMF